MAQTACGFLLKLATRPFRSAKYQLVSRGVHKQAALVQLSRATV
jgi:hypothetical protein